MRALVLWVLFVISIPHLCANETRARILAARFPWCNMWKLANDIETWKESELEDPQVTKKLLEIITWTRSSIFNSPNLHLRRVKRAATDVLLAQTPPVSNQVTLISRSLDKATLSPILEGNLDTADYVYIAELLVDWAKKGSAVATEEMLRAIESSSATKVFEIEFALARMNAQDPEWLPNNSETLTRIKRALGRPWVFELLRHYYEKDLRFSQHSENQFYLAHERPLGTQLSPDELSSHLTIEEASLFHFFLTLDSVNQKPGLLLNRYESSLRIAAAIEETLQVYPHLASNAYFAAVALQSIETFGIHSPYIDQLVAKWVDTDFVLHKEVVQTPENYEKGLIKQIRSNAFGHLVHIQQRYRYAQTRERASRMSEATQQAIGLHFLPAALPNSTAVDEQAVRLSLASRFASNERKLELIDADMMDDPFIQATVLKLALDPHVQMRALERLNMATSLSPKQIAELATIIGISSPEEANLYLVRHDRLRAQFSNLPPGGSILGSCGRKIRRLIGF